MLNTEFHAQPFLPFASDSQTERKQINKHMSAFNIHTKIEDTISKN